jgi:predicted XRE-type DNA-binding protein
VYADLGFPNSGAMLRKAELVHEISRTITRAGCTETEAARRLSVPYTELSKVLRGQFETIPEGSLKAWLARLSAEASAMSPLASGSPLRPRDAKRRDELALERPAEREVFVREVVKPRAPGRTLTAAGKRCRFRSK